MNRSGVVAAELLSELGLQPEDMLVVVDDVEVLVDVDVGEQPRELDEVALLQELPEALPVRQRQRVAPLDFDEELLGGAQRLRIRFQPFRAATASRMMSTYSSVSTPAENFPRSYPGRLSAADPERSSVYLVTGFRLSPGEARSAARAHRRATP